MRSKVWVIWDRLYERIVSVHKTEHGADVRCVLAAIQRDMKMKTDNAINDFECDEFEVEE